MQETELGLALGRLLAHAENATHSGARQECLLTRIEDNTRNQGCRAQCPAPGHQEPHASGYSLVAVADLLKALTPLVLVAGAMVLRSSNPELLAAIVGLTGHK